MPNLFAICVIVICFTLILSGTGHIILRRQIFANAFPIGTPKVRQKAILTGNEAEFFSRLCYALPHHMVFSQVAMSALMEPDTDPTDYKKWYAIRRHFAAKFVDFVVYDAARNKIVAIVELDDRTHDPEKDALRDAMLMRAGYRVLRYQSTMKPTPEYLQQEILNPIRVKLPKRVFDIAPRNHEIVAGTEDAPARVVL